MENFSTPPKAMLPWIANLATLAVVVAAIGWSGGQRPDVPATAAASAVLAAPQTATQTAPVADRAAKPTPGSTQGQWPAKTTARTTDGLQAVGYTARQLP